MDRAYDSIKQCSAAENVDAALLRLAKQSGLHNFRNSKVTRKIPNINRKTISRFI